MCADDLSIFRCALLRAQIQIFTWLKEMAILFSKPVWNTFSGYFLALKHRQKIPYDPEIMFRNKKATHHRITVFSACWQWEKAMMNIVQWQKRKL